MVETDEISSWIKQICMDGTKQLTEFVEQIIQLQNKDFFEPIAKNKVSNFSL